MPSLKPFEVTILAIRRLSLKVRLRARSPTLKLGILVEGQTNSTQMQLRFDPGEILK